jgi:hypothetical protein
MLHRKAPTLKMGAPDRFTFIIGNFYQTLRRHIFSALLIPLLSSKFLAVVPYIYIYIYILSSLFSLYFLQFGSLFSFLCIFPFPPFILDCPFLVPFLPGVLVSCPLHSICSLSNTHIKPIYYVTS